MLSLYNRGMDTFTVQRNVTLSHESLICSLMKMFGLFRELHQTVNVIIVKK